MLKNEIKNHLISLEEKVEAFDGFICEKNGSLVDPEYLQLFLKTKSTFEELTALFKDDFLVRKSISCEDVIRKLSLRLVQKYEPDANKVNIMVSAKGQISLELLEKIMPAILNCLELIPNESDTFVNGYKSVYFSLHMYSDHLKFEMKTDQYFKRVEDLAGLRSVLTESFGTFDLNLQDNKITTITVQIPILFGRVDGVIASSSGGEFILPKLAVRQIFSHFEFCHLDIDPSLTFICYDPILGPTLADKEQVSKFSYVIFLGVTDKKFALGVDQVYSPTKARIVQSKDLMAESSWIEQVAIFNRNESGNILPYVGSQDLARLLGEELK